MRLLLVEDDPALGPKLAKGLRKKGFAIDLVSSGIEAEYMGDEIPYDIVVLDLGLPDLSGMDVLKRWRSKGNNVSVLILTARNDWQERVDGFQAGADDYLGKPFYFEELLERINALIRRSHITNDENIQISNIHLDHSRQTVRNRNNEEYSLTGTEYRLLRYMMLHKNEILSKYTLSEHIYDDQSDKNSNIIEVYIRRLRKILGDDLIQTKRGQGYVFGEKQ